MEISSCELDACPYCGSSNISAEEADWETMGRRVTCIDCKRFWDEWFTVTTVYIPEENERIYRERRFIEVSCACGSNEICMVHEVSR